MSSCWTRAARTTIKQDVNSRVHKDGYAFPPRRNGPSFQLAKTVSGIFAMNKPVRPVKLRRSDEGVVMKHQRRGKQLRVGLVDGEDTVRSEDPEGDEIECDAGPEN